MDFIDELRKGFSVFHSAIHENGHDDILSMPYEEYSLQCFVLYKDMLYGGILHANNLLARAFSVLGITQPRDQLVIFLETFYLSNRLNSNHPN